MSASECGMTSNSTFYACPSPSPKLVISKEEARLRHCDCCNIGDTILTEDTGQRGSDATTTATTTSSPGMIEQ